MYKEFKFLNCNACKATQWTNDVDDYDGLDKSPSKKKIGGRNFIPGDVDDYNASNTPFHCYLKFILLFGLFSLGGSQQAVAGSDFASGLQSISFFGDLGDISKVCLLVYFGVSTLLDANSGDGLKAEEEQKNHGYNSTSIVHCTRHTSQRKPAELAGSSGQQLGGVLQRKQSNDDLFPQNTALVDEQSSDLNKNSIRNVVERRLQASNLNLAKDTKSIKKVPTSTLPMICL